MSKSGDNRAKGTLAMADPSRVVVVHGYVAARHSVGRSDQVSRQQEARALELPVPATGVARGVQARLQPSPRAMVVNGPVTHSVTGSVTDRDARRSAQHADARWQAGQAWSDVATQDARRAELTELAEAARLAGAHGPTLADTIGPIEVAIGRARDSAIAQARTLDAQASRLAPSTPERNKPAQPPKGQSLEEIARTRSLDRDRAKALRAYRNG